MKVKFNHEYENIDELVENVEITDLPEGVEEGDVKSEILTYSMNIQNFHLGLLVEYFNLRDGVQMTRVSEFVETIVNDLGWEKFQEFSQSITQSLQEAAEELAQEAEAEASEEAEGN